MNEKEGEGFWAVHVRKLCEKYRLPNPAKMLDEDCPTKESWKKKVDEMIKAYYTNLFKEKLEYMRTLNIMDKEVILDGSLKPCLSSRFPGSARTIKIVNSMMIGEYRNLDWQVRNQKIDDDTCRLCGLEREDVTRPGGR